LPVVWIREADAELKEAHAWYENVRPELGERFARAVEATVEAITESPLQFPVIYRGRRRAGVRRFPYGIFFEIQEHRVVVIACFQAGAIRNASKHAKGNANVCLICPGLGVCREYVSTSLTLRWRYIDQRQKNAGFRMDF
jgi:plasmid stabilization system protein ParE